MNPCPCDDLDGYLAGWLLEDEQGRFEAHLADCPACSLALRQQRRIDRLLAGVAACAEPAPPALVGRIEGRIRAFRLRRARRWALGLSTAAAALLAVGLWLAAREQSTTPELAPIVENPVEPEADPPQAPPLAQLASDPQPPARVSLANASDGIVVPVETSNPNVSIVWIYRAVTPARSAGTPDDQGP
jgi:hypothetical protein